MQTINANWISTWLRDSLHWNPIRFDWVFVFHCSRCNFQRSCSLGKIEKMHKTEIRWNKLKPKMIIKKKNKKEKKSFGFFLFAWTKTTSAVHRPKNHNGWMSWLFTRALYNFLLLFGNWLILSLSHIVRTHFRFVYVIEHLSLSSLDLYRSPLWHWQFDTVRSLARCQSNICDNSKLFTFAFNGCWDAIFTT